MDKKKIRRKRGGGGECTANMRKIAAKYVCGTSLTEQKNKILLNGLWLHNRKIRCTVQFVHCVQCILTVKRPILKSSLMRQIAPLEYINTLLKRSIPKKPR